MKQSEEVYDKLMEFYDPLFFILDLVCKKYDVNPVELMTPKTNRSYTMMLYMAMVLSYDNFNIKTGKTKKLYTIYDLGSFFDKAHPLISVAKRKADRWCELGSKSTKGLYFDYMVYRKFFDLKIKEKYDHTV